MPDLHIQAHHELNTKELFCAKEDIANSSVEDEDLMEDVVEDEDADEEEYNELEQFAQVLDNIELDRLPAFALSIRMQNMLSNTCQTSTSTHAEISQLTCSVASPPLFGSYNILFPLVFSDGIRWLFKVPISGCPGQFDELAAQALTSEAMTMQLLRRETTIPVPEVYAFDASLNNDIKCPFIMMEHLQGQPLHHLWFQPLSSQSTVEQFRKRILQELAGAMSQLNAFIFGQGGSLVFDGEGKVAGVGPCRVADLIAQNHKLCHDDDYDGSPIFCAKGPFSDVKSFMKFSLDRHGPLQAAPAKLHKGVHKLLGKFIDWIPCNGTLERSPFVLMHPDYALQNILVSEDGALKGIIDWDGAAAIPRCMGQYPLWLTRDWDPATYNYDVQTAALCDPDGQLEDTPEQLSTYRHLYAQFMQQSVLDLDGRDDAYHAKGGLSTPVLDRSIDSTIHKSILPWSLAVAANDTDSRNGNMRIIFEEINRLLANDKPDGTSAKYSTASSGDKTRVEKSTNNTEETFAHSNESASTDGCKDADDTIDIDRSEQETRFAGPEYDTPPTCPTSQPVEMEAGRNRNVKPICYRIQDAIRYNSKVLYKKNLKMTHKDVKPLQPIIQPVVVEACPSERAQPRGYHIQSALEHVLEHLRKACKVSTIDTDAQSADIVVRTRGNSQFSRGRFQKAWEAATGLLHKQKVNDPKKDTETQLKAVKPNRNWIRRTFHKTVELLHNERSNESPKFGVSQLAVVQACTNVKVEPCYAGVWNTPQPSLPILEDTKIKVLVARGNLSLDDGALEDFYNQIIRQLDGAFTNMSKEHRAFVELAIRQGVKTLPTSSPSPKPETQTAPGVLKSAVVAETNVVAPPTPAKMEKKEYKPSPLQLWTIAHDIADEKLSDEMWQRVKGGFLALMDSL